MSEREPRCGKAGARAAPMIYIPVLCIGVRTSGEEALLRSVWLLSFSQPQSKSPKTREASAKPGLPAIDYQKGTVSGYNFGFHGGQVANAVV